MPNFMKEEFIPQLKNPDGSTPQKRDKSGGAGGVNKDVPEDIIQKAVQQKNSGGNFQSVALSEPLFGLLGVENLDPTSVTFNLGEEGCPSWGNGNHLQMNFTVTRNKETGALNFTMTAVIDKKTGKPIVGPMLPIPSIDGAGLNFNFRLMPNLAPSF
jgi:hypothetical protein